MDRSAVTSALLNAILSKQEEEDADSRIKIDRKADKLSIQPPR